VDVGLGFEVRDRGSNGGDFGGGERRLGAGLRLLLARALGFGFEAGRGEERIARIVADVLQIRSENRRALAYDAVSSLRVPREIAWHPCGSPRSRPWRMRRLPVT